MLSEVSAGCWVVLQLSGIQGTRRTFKNILQNLFLQPCAPDCTTIIIRVILSQGSQQSVWLFPPITVRAAGDCPRTEPEAPTAAAAAMAAPSTTRSTTRARRATGASTTAATAAPSAAAAPPTLSGRPSRWRRRCRRATGTVRHVVCGWH